MRNTYKYHVLIRLIAIMEEIHEIDDDPMVEVLFEYKGSRKALCFQVSKSYL